MSLNPTKSYKTVAYKMGFASGNIICVIKPSIQVSNY